MKKLVCMLMAICTSFSLCSCYDNREIDMTAYVIALGIDKAEDSYNYTFQISSPLSMGGGGEIGDMGKGEENNRVENIIIGAKDLYEARAVINNFLSKKINLSHLKMIAISKEVAIEGLTHHMNFILQEREVRPNTRMCVAIGKAENFLKGINPALEANTAEYYDLIFENGAVLSQSKKLWEFVNETETFGTVLPIGRTSEYKESSEFSGDENIRRISSSKSEFAGLCMFKEYTEVGELSPEKSKIYGLLTGKIPEAEVSLEKNGKTCSVKLIPQEKSAFSIKESEEALTAIMKIGLMAEVNSSGENIKEREIEDYLSREAYAIFLEAQKAKCDIFGIGKYVKVRCKTVKEWESINWDDYFEKLYFLPKIDITIRKTETGTV